MSEPKTKNTNNNVFINVTYIPECKGMSRQECDWLLWNRGSWKLAPALFKYPETALNANRERRHND